MRVSSSCKKYCIGFMALAAMLVFLPQSAQACFCAQKPDGGYICETHCAPHEIDMALGPDHGPVQMVTGYLTTNALPEGVPIPGTTTTTTSTTGTTVNTGTGTSTGSGNSSTSSCYMTSMGDYICPPTGSSDPAAPGTKPGIGAPIPHQTIDNPTPPLVFPQPSPAGPGVSIGNSATAYQWPPGFGCSAANNLVGPPPVGQSPADWKMTFMEEFNTFDTGIWNDTIWYEQSNPTKNYAVENGALKIWPQRDASGNFFNRTIDTDGKYYQTYGYFEIEAKLPVGVGTWPAFWLFNHIGDRRPEMDVMEAYAGGAAPWGFDQNGIAHPQAYAPTVWKGDHEGQLVGSRQYDTGMDLSTGFHTYAVKWEPGVQIYYFDGKEVLTLNVDMPDPMYLMLDLWYGSASGTPGDATPQGKSNSYEVNYVRAWENCGSTGSSTGSAANGGSSATDGNTVGGTPPATGPAACVPNNGTQVVDYYGDSTVWGLSPAGGRASTPAPQHFANALGLTVNNEGVNSTTACQLLNGADGKHPAWATQMANSNATVVIINHAINDQWAYDLNTYKNCLSSLVQIAKGAGKQVILETPNPTRDNVGIMAAAMKEVASSQGAGVIDQYTYLMGQLNGASVTTLVPDGLHPSDEGYRLKGAYAASVFPGLASGISATCP